jgi:hypothetical protein
MIRTCIALALFAAATLPGISAEAVKITETNDILTVEINGELFTEYHFKGAPHVYFYPLLGPGGLSMTRDYPMVADSKNEEHDHNHHRSLWFAHGDVNKIDFWTEGASTGKIVHDKFIEIKSGDDFGLIKSQNNWVARTGEVICRSEQTVRIYNRPKNERLMDFDTTIFALDKPLVLGDTKEGTFAIRVAETMRVTQPRNKKGDGHIILETGLTGTNAWAKRASWCDYYGPVKDKTLGIAIFDHPENPRHPTYWHVRDYGLFAVNPFGMHDFEGKPAGTGNMTIEPGKSITFRYRIYIHEGDEKQAKVAERYKEYSEGK